MAKSHTGLISIPKSQKGTSENPTETFGKMFFYGAALLSVFSLFLIAAFLLKMGLPAVLTIGPREFLFGTVYKPEANLFGNLPMIFGTLAMTGLSLLIAVPLGLFCAICLCYFLKGSVAEVFASLLAILASIPSVVYGFFGLVLIVPLVREFFGGRGMSLLSASLLLAWMILPTIAMTAHASLSALEGSLYESALALGATHEEVILDILFPAAKRGIIGGILLGLSRAAGETMAVLMVAGNQPRIPTDLLQGVRSLTTNIALEMGYATDLHRQALIGSGVLLFLFIFLVNLFVFFLTRRMGHDS